jgi:hypothetical protein
VVESFITPLWTALTTWLLGLPESCALAALSHAWKDGDPLHSARPRMQAHAKDEQQAMSAYEVFIMIF